MRKNSKQIASVEQMEDRKLFATIVVINTADTGAGSLRDAITKANKTAAADTITFAIGSGAKTISPTSKPLPYIQYPITIDGTTQPGYAGKPIIEIRGDKTYGDGLVVGGGSSTIKGLVINRFKGNGMLIVNGSGNTVKGNYIGLDLAGSADAGNGGKGIVVQTANNTIGGTNAADRNVISGNNTGLQFWTYKATNNKVLGNYLGTDATGEKAVGNDTSGIVINGAPSNTIGGTEAGARNIISGNKQDGVVINQAGARGNQVIGNYIGTDKDGESRVGNLWYGVEISRENNVVTNNVISGNSYSGLVLWLSSSYGNKVTGNLIGTDKTGTKDIGNYWRGIDVSNGAKDNIIGGATTAERNIVSGNDEAGILVYQGSNNKFQNNYVGTDITGTKALQNFGDGFRLVQTNTVSILGGIIGYNGGYAVHNGASKSTYITTSTKLINNVLFLVKFSA